MVRHRDVHDATPLVGQDQQDEQKSARCGRDDEKVRGYDLSDVVRQERAPRL
jgi:hypothetical protein